MPLWRCPHCATPQAETARCWVCHRSSTACGACRHFRRSISAQLGYCGLDRLRQPLTGEEIRACWEAADGTGATLPSLPGVGPVWPLELADDRTAVRPLQFVEVPPSPIRERRRDPTLQTDEAAEAGADDPADSLFLTSAPGGESRWSLWGEAEA